MRYQETMAAGGPGRPGGDAGEYPRPQFDLVIRGLNLAPTLSAQTFHGIDRKAVRCGALERALTAQDTKFVIREDAKGKPG